MPGQELGPSDCQPGAGHVEQFLSESCVRASVVASAGRGDLTRVPLTSSNMPKSDVNPSARKPEVAAWRERTTLSAV
jgi:hypothetical protein